METIAKTVEKGIVAVEGLGKYKKSKGYYPIFQNQLKDYMERDPGGMANKIRAYRNRRA